MDELDLASLQNNMAVVDVRRWPPRVGGWGEARQLRITMCLARGQGLPCFEIGYGTHDYAARFAIGTGKRMEGNLDRKYDRAIELWAARNRAQLMAIWGALQSERNGHTFTAMCAAPAEWNARRILRAQPGPASQD